jgi:hypothetical protein
METPINSPPIQESKKRKEPELLDEPQENNTSENLHPLPSENSSDEYPSPRLFPPYDAFSSFDQPLNHTCQVTIPGYAVTAIPVSYNPSGYPYYGYPVAYQFPPLQNFVAQEQPAYQPQKNAQESAQLAENPIFKIAVQPNPKQRKSYLSEKRYLLPNPIVIELGDSFKKEINSIVHGHVYTTLHTADGELANQNSLKVIQPFKLDILMRAHMPIKIISNSPHGGYYLLFRITYKKIDGRTYYEVIRTISFEVKSNKTIKLLSGKKPTISAISRSEGNSQISQDVWFSGDNLSDPSIDLFIGNMKLAIYHRAENLIKGKIPSSDEPSLKGSKYHFIMKIGSECTHFEEITYTFL